MTPAGPHEPPAYLAVVNNPSESRFELVVDGSLAVVAYGKMGAALIAYTHTEVPEALSGRGIGARLAHAALEYARTNGLAVLPFYPFVSAYIRRHNGYLPLVSPRYKGFDTT